MKLSDDVNLPLCIDETGNEEKTFSFLEAFSPLADMPATPRFLQLAGSIQQNLHYSPDATKTEVDSVIRNALSLYGGDTTGVAISRPREGASEEGGIPIIVNLARILGRFALENEGISEEGFSSYLDILGEIEDALLRISPTEWPELIKFPQGDGQALFNLHYDLSPEPIYDLVAPFWQRAALAQMRGGLLIAPSSMSAFLTPLRQFTRKYPRENLPKNLFHMTAEERADFARDIRAFFNDQALFSFSQRTRDDYGSTVILALKMIPEMDHSRPWTWKYSSHVVKQDNDPSESDDAGDGFRYDSYMLAVRKTAESLEDITTLSILQESGLDDTAQGVQEPAVGKTQLSNQELAWIHQYSSGRYAMASFRTPFTQASLSIHVLCVFDHWIGNHIDPVYRMRWALLFHLLLVTGRSLDWVLSLRFGCPSRNDDPGVAYFDPATQSIVTETMLKLGLPCTPDNEAVRKAYLPTTYQISIPVSSLAAEWIRTLRGKTGQPEGENFLFVHPDGSAITRTDVRDSLLQPFTEYLLSKQPGLPAMTLGRLRRAFWGLYTWQGLPPEDAVMISDQYYLDVRAPMFYACRSRKEFQSSYQRAFTLVTLRLWQVYSDLYPNENPLTLQVEDEPFQEVPQPEESYYGACYCPRPEKLKRLITTIMGTVQEQWPESEIKKRNDLLSYACAFGISLGLGLRVGEAAGLTHRSVDHRAGTIAVNGKKDRFAEEMRVLPIPLFLKEPLLQLSECRRRFGITGDRNAPFFYIFQGRTAPVPLSRERLWRQLRQWETQAETEEGVFRWHALRHSMASHLLQDGTLTFSERSYFLGHMAGQQWLEDLQPGEQKIVFDHFNSIISKRMVELGFNLTGFCLFEKGDQS